MHLRKGLNEPYLQTKNVQLEYSVHACIPCMKSLDTNRNPSTNQKKDVDLVPKKTFHYSLFHISLQ